MSLVKVQIWGLRNCKKKCGPMYSGSTTSVFECPLFGSHWLKENKLLLL